MTIYTDRSRVQLYRRCPRARWLEYHEGADGMGLVPRRKSLHLVIGLGFHAGMEALLRANLGDALNDSQDTEEKAAAAAVAAVRAHMSAGVELDPQENPGFRMLPGEQEKLKLEKEKEAVLVPAADSPLEFSFEDSAGAATATSTSVNFSDPIYPSDSSQPDSGLDSSLDSSLDQPVSASSPTASSDDYLERELCALVEAMTRAYARRRLPALLAEFEVLEVEREGSWELGDLPCDYGTCDNCGHYHSIQPQGRREGCSGISQGSLCPCREFVQAPASEIHWMSRHDGLLLHRDTGFLHILSFKTTGSWDERKLADAQVDMQGLSEAVDIENRLEEAWGYVHHSGFYEDPSGKIVTEWAVSARTASWLRTQPSPPRIHAVRYEYALKGQRRKDKTTLPGTPARFRTESPLILPYCADGITLEDRRLAPSYEWQDTTGKTKRLDYRTWKRRPIWEMMPVRSWIDCLDRGDYWPGAGEDFAADGQPADVLADQFIPPVTVYRSEDDLRDWLEQVEAQEVGVALAVAKVRRAEGEGAKRSALNRLFPQNRQACSYPGQCAFRPICYGGEDIRRDPLANSELYQIRTANHPIELGES